MNQGGATGEFSHIVELYQARRMDEAHAAMTAGLTTYPDFFAQVPPATIMAAILSVWRGDYGQALKHWREGQNLSGAAPASPLAAAHPLPWRTPRAARRAPPLPLAIATSLQPKRLNDQQVAVATWQALGAQVLSVNGADEIGALRQAFPGVTFVPTERTGEANWRRPFVAIDALLDALAETGAPVVGLVNSDILITPDPAVLEMLTAETDGALIFGNRVDIDSLDKLDGVPMEQGFDFFFLRAASIPRFRGNDYYMGLTWWDYWIVLQAAATGLTTRRLMSPVAFHVKHHQAWSMASFVAFRNQFIRHMSAQLPALPDLPPSHRYLGALLDSYADHASHPVTAADTPSQNDVAMTENLAFHIRELAYSTAEPITVA